MALRSCITALLAAAVLVPAASAQLNSLTPEELKKFTAQNPYDRFPDGRPKVPDAVLQQMKDMSSEELMNAGSRGVSQYVDGWKILHPGKTLVGRAFTLQLMPIRAEVADVAAKEWKEKGNARPLSHQSAIDLLQPGDVLVVDAFGSADVGGIIGDNLAYYIYKTTGAGFVIDGAIRDLQGVFPFDMAGYYREAVPGWIHGVMVTGINVPVRIGNTTVMPGDVVFGDREGVTFVPPHQVQKFIDEARVTHIHDEWTKKKFDEGKYKSSDIYGRPHDPALIKEYEDYLKSKLGAEAYAEYKKRQTNQ